MQTSSHYQTRPVDLHQDRHLLLDLWRANFAQRVDWERKLEWFYSGCPFGSPIVQVLEHRGRAVGVAAVGPRRFEVAGQSIHGGVLADMVVAPSHRMLGPALQLQRSLVARASGHYDLLYGFPNRKAVPVFQRCGYKQLSEVARYVKILRFDQYARRVFPSAAAALVARALDTTAVLGRALRRRRRRGINEHWAQEIDQEADFLWENSDRGTNAISARTSTFIRWRMAAGGQPGTPGTPLPMPLPSGRWRRTLPRKPRIRA